MEVLNRFIEICQRKPVVLQDSIYSEYSDMGRIEFYYVPVMFAISFLTTVYWLLRHTSGHSTSDLRLDNPPLPVVNEGGDSNPMDDDTPEEPWEFREEYPSPY